MIEYFAIITISKPEDGAVLQGTFTCTMQVGPDATQVEIYEYVSKQIPNRFRGGTVVFYDARPNRTTTGPS